MRICPKLHSEGHSQGKFGICESGISDNSMVVSLEYDSSFVSFSEKTSFSMLTVLYENILAIIRSVNTT